MCLELKPHTVQSQGGDRTSSITPIMIGSKIINTGRVIYKIEEWGIGSGAGRTRRGEAVHWYSQGRLYFNVIIMHFTYCAR